MNPGQAIPILQLTDTTEEQMENKITTVVYNNTGSEVRILNVTNTIGV